MPLTCRVFQACLVLLLGVGVAGQQPPAPAGPTTSPPSGLVLGRVVDATSGTPISGVLLTLVGPPPQVNSSGAPFSARAMLSDAQGRFVFGNLAKASYTLTAELG